MPAMVDSPNWYWSLLGASVERYGKIGLDRRITIRGEIICDAIGHQEEIDIARKLLNNKPRKNI